MFCCHSSIWSRSQDKIELESRSPACDENAEQRPREYSAELEALCEELRATLDGLVRPEAQPPCSPDTPGVSGVTWLSGRRSGLPCSHVGFSLLRLLCWPLLLCLSLSLTSQDAVLDLCSLGPVCWRCQATRAGLHGKHAEALWAPSVSCHHSAVWRRMAVAVLQQNLIYGLGNLTFI